MSQTAHVPPQHYEEPEPREQFRYTMRYEVHYQFATFAGQQKVLTSEDELAIEIVRRWARSQPGLSVCSESYQVLRREVL